jgi:OOP family OmpA-OmpF porin
MGSDHYAKKALLAERGIHPDPEELFLRSIGTKNLNELADARNQLEAAFARHARWYFPREAADAQLAFDCWVEETERLFSGKRREQCRTTFWNAIAAMKKPIPQPTPVMVEPAPVAAAPVAATVVEVVMPQPFIVFFDFDKDTLAPGAEAVLASVAREYGNFKPSKLSLLGNADTKGTYPYNDDLSVRRVKRVQEELAKLGIPAGSIEITAMGERAPRVITGDEVKEPANRYVTITFVK